MAFKYLNTCSFSLIEKGKLKTHNKVNFNH